MASRGGPPQQQSVISVLTEILQLLTEAKLMPDAPRHMEVIQALEQGIIQYIQMDRQKSIQQAIQGPQPGAGGGQPPGMGGPPGGGPPGAGGPPGGGGGMGGPPGAGGPGGPAPGGPAPGGGGGNLGFGTPDPDELRRVLAGPAAVGG